MLKGQAKRDYQREYMRKRRAKGLTQRSNVLGLTGSNISSISVRPVDGSNQVGADIALPKQPEVKQFVHDIPEFNPVTGERYSANQIAFLKQQKDSNARPE